jgi:hypothetical protein
MMRRILFALAGVFAAGLIASSHAQTPGAPEVSAEDRTFYAAVAGDFAGDSPNDADVSWSKQSRGGIVRFAAPDTSRCRTFFLRQFNPEVRPAVIGKACPLGGGEYAVTDIRPAAAAGPTGSGVTRGVVLSPPAAPSRDVPPPPAPPPAASPPPAPRTDTRPISRNEQLARPGLSKGGSTIVVKPVLVQIDRATLRLSQNGGHAVVLLQDIAATRARNLQLCTSLLDQFDDAPLSDVRVGLIRNANGTVSALRPIYWPVDERVQVTGSSCAQRLQRYDYARARTIRDKLKITGQGPYLVVTRSDERQAAIINLTGMTAAEIEQATRYFGAGLSQRGEVWNPQRFTPQEQERSLIAVVGRDFPRVLLAAVGFYSAAATGAGAAATGNGCLGDLSDTRRC